MRGSAPQTPRDGIIPSTLIRKSIRFCKRLISIFKIREVFDFLFLYKKRKGGQKTAFIFQNQQIQKLVNFDDCFFVVSAARFANLVRNHQFTTFAAFYQAGCCNFPALCFSLISLISLSCSFCPFNCYCLPSYSVSARACDYPGSTSLC